MSVYYNEIDPYCCEWLNNLIQTGELPAGDVDSRSIEKVTPDEVRKYTHCHFFAGLGGWAYAAKLAEWPADKPLWTGSCPCQPFSVSGEGKGFSDPRHLWPQFFRLIRTVRPSVVFGEQVTGKAGYIWFDQVADDLESCRYPARAFDLTASAVGAEHVRPRLYWVAHSLCEGLERFKPQRSGIRSQPQPPSTKCGHTSLPTRVFKSATPSSVLSTNGLSHPVGIIRAFGNAVVPQVAAEVLLAYLESEAEHT